MVYYVKILQLRVVCTNIDPTLIKDQHNFKAKYLKKGEDY